MLLFIPVPKDGNAKDKEIRKSHEVKDAVIQALSQSAAIVGVAFYHRFAHGTLGKPLPLKKDESY